MQHFPALPYLATSGIVALRRSRKENQTVFWRRLGVEQCVGSRYENGRSVPAPTLLLLNLVYGDASVREQVVSFVRSEDFAATTDIKRWLVPSNGNTSSEDGSSLLGGDRVGW